MMNWANLQSDIRTVTVFTFELLNKFFSYIISKPILFYGLSITFLMPVFALILYFIRDFISIVHIDLAGMDKSSMERFKKKDKEEERQRKEAYYYYMYRETLDSM